MCCVRAPQWEGWGVADPLVCPVYCSARRAAGVNAIPVVIRRQRQHTVGVRAMASATQVSLLRSYRWTAFLQRGMPSRGYAVLLSSFITSKHAAGAGALELDDIMQCRNGSLPCSQPACSCLKELPICLLAIPGHLTAPAAQRQEQPLHWSGSFVSCAFEDPAVPLGTSQHTALPAPLACPCTRFPPFFLQVPVKDVATKPIEGQKTGTSGLRKKTKVCTSAGGQGVYECWSGLVMQLHGW